MLDAGMNEWIAAGFVQMQSAQQSGSLYDDYNIHKPVLGKVKLVDFTKVFAQAYNN